MKTNLKDALARQKIKVAAAQKKAKKIKSQLKICQHGLKSSFNDLCPGPKPTRFYKVGDRVRHGNWGWSAILDVFDNGMYYKLISVTRNTNRNVPDSTSFKIHYMDWYAFVSYRTREHYDLGGSLIQNNDIFFSYSQRDLSSLISMYLGKYGIDLDPDYQRGNAWKPYQKVDLIDSIFNNIDIGKFVVIKRPWGPDGNKPITPKLYEMLDGKQRIMAIVEFYLGLFTYKGKTFDQLCPTDKNHFTYYRISEAECDPLTDEQKYRYFLKLNTTGTPVDPEHMEKVEGMLKNV